MVVAQPARVGYNVILPGTLDGRCRLYQCCLALCRRELRLLRVKGHHIQILKKKGKRETTSNCKNKYWLFFVFYQNMTNGFLIIVDNKKYIWYIIGRKEGARHEKNHHYDTCHSVYDNSIE